MTSMCALGRALLLGGLAVIASACNPLGVVTQASQFSSLRDEAVAQCCQCLAAVHIRVDAPDLACPDAPLAPGPDAGPPGPVLTPCLCEQDEVACRQRLNSAQDITIVGLCLERERLCRTSCDGVIAFPSE